MLITKIHSYLTDYHLRLSFVFRFSSHASRCTIDNRRKMFSSSRVLLILFAKWSQLEWLILLFLGFQLKNNCCTINVFLSIKIYPEKSINWIKYFEYFEPGESLLWVNHYGMHLVCNPGYFSCWCTSEKPQQRNLESWNHFRNKESWWMDRFFFSLFLKWL